MRRSLLTHLALFTLVAFGLFLGTAATVSASTTAESEETSAIPESTEAGSTAGEQTMEGEFAPKPKHQPTFLTCMGIKNAWVGAMNKANDNWDDGDVRLGNAAHNTSMELLDDYWNLCYDYYGPMGDYINPGDLTR